MAAGATRPLDGVGEQLMAEADAEVGPLHVDDEVANGGSFGEQPGVLLFLPHVLGSAHDQHQVERIEIGDRLSLVEFDRLPREPVLAEELAEDSGMLDGGVLQDQYSHLILVQIGWRTSYGQKAGGFVNRVRSRLGFAGKQSALACNTPAVAGERAV